MARIFLSSTFNDLREYRAAADRTLRQLGHDVISMEDYVAEDRRPQDKTLADIAAADLYLGIVGWRYGHIPTEDNPDERSITEIEYRHAQKLRKPTLIFLVEKDAPWPVDDVEFDRRDRLEAFREELSRARVVSFFTSVTEFTAKLAEAIALWDRDRAKPPQVVTLADLPLAWRLVIDFKGEPDLLRHADFGMFTAALDKWEDDTGADRNAPWSTRLETALKALEAKQSPHAPSTLWLAWMGATRAPGPTADVPASADHLHDAAADVR